MSDKHGICEINYACNIEKGTNVFGIMKKIYLGHNLWNLNNQFRNPNKVYSDSIDNERVQMLRKV